LLPSASLIVCIGLPNVAITSVWFEVPVLNWAIWSLLIKVAELSVQALSVSNAGTINARDLGIIAYP
jgi:hypothetical protein